MKKTYVLLAMLILSIFLIGCGSEAPIEDSEPVRIEEPVPKQVPVPQEKPAAPAAPEPAPIPKQTSTITPARDLTGTWEGSMDFTNNCPNPTCRYKGKMNPPAIVMELEQDGNDVEGEVTVFFANIEVEELANMGCDTFEQMVDQEIRSSSDVENGKISSTKFTFTDIGGNFWELMLTTDLLQGTIENSAPGCMGIESENVKLSRKRFE